MAIKYKWLAKQLELLAEQKSGNPKAAPLPQNKLPTEQAIALRYHVSRQTVRSALKLLEEKGMIQKVQGSGIYLTGKLADPARNQVFLILHKDPEFFAPKLYQELSLSLQESGFSLLCKTNSNCFQTERELLTGLLKETPRGLFIQPVQSALPNPNRDLYRYLMKKGCHILFLFSPCPDFPDIPCIRHNDYYGCSTLVQKLIALGHTSIGALFQADDRASQDRFLSFMETMQQAGISVPDCHVSWYDSTLAEQICRQGSGTGLFPRLINDGFSDCTALICDHDGILWRLMQELDSLKGDNSQAPFSGFPEDASIKNTLSECVFFGCFLQGHLTERLKGSRTLLLCSDQKNLGELAFRTFSDSIKGLPVQSREVPWTFF